MFKIMLVLPNSWVPNTYVSSLHGRNQLSSEEVPEGDILD